MYTSSGSVAPGGAGRTRRTDAAGFGWTGSFIAREHEV